MWFSSGSRGLIVVLYQVAGVLPAQRHDSYQSLLVAGSTRFFGYVLVIDRHQGLKGQSMRQSNFCLGSNSAFAVGALKETS
jgi:hypothetical protein